MRSTERERTSAGWMFVLIASALLVLFLMWRLADQDSHSPAPLRSPNRAQAGPLPATPSAADRGRARTEDFRREPAIEPGKDAANFYKDAFVLFDRLTDEEKKMLKNPTAEVDADKAAELFKKIQPIMELMRQVAALEVCNWGYGETTFDTPLPHLDKAVDLGRVAFWSAAYQIASDPQAAIDDLKLRQTLGTHLSDLLIGGLVAVSFERGAIDLIRDHAPNFDAATQARAAEFLAASSIDSNYRSSMAGEAAAFVATFEKLAAMPEAERIRRYSMMDSEWEGRNADPHDVIELVLKDRSVLEAETRFVEKLELEMADSLAWPDEKYREWKSQKEQEIESSHPLVKNSSPSLDHVREAYRRMSVEHGLLAAGLDVLQNGVTKVGSHADPVTGVPFTVVPTANGFEVRSTFHYKGKALTMSFAAPP